MAMKRNGATLLPVGRTFSHPELGPCTVLGQWQFFDDKEVEHNWTYLYTQPPVPPALLNNDQLWDDSPLVTKRLTSSLTKHINKTFVTALTPAFYSTPELMMERTTRHPMFLEVDSFHVSQFGRALKADYPGAFRVARSKQKKVAEQLEGHVDGVKAMFKEMLTLFAMMGDDMRRTLQPFRPRKADKPGEDPSEVLGQEFTLSENGAVALEAIAALSGFYEESDGVWAPTTKEATHRFLNFATGVSYFRRCWLFHDAKPRIEDCAEKTIYECAEAELGAARLHSDGLLLPAWLLRLKIEQKLVDAEDARVRAHAVVVLTSVRIRITGRTVVGAGKKKHVIGAAVNLTWQWQGWSRDDPAGIMNPHFSHVIASVIDGMTDAEVAEVTGGDDG